MTFAALLLALALWQATTDPAGFPGFTPYDPEHDVEKPAPEPPYTAATAPDPKFPLRIHVFATNRRFFGTYYLGNAAADLLGPPEQGLELNYKCAKAFASNVEPDAFYQARWKKPDHRIELLLQKPGGGKIERCEASVKMKSAPFRS